jgi:hypothetical protein
MMPAATGTQNGNCEDISILNHLWIPILIFKFQSQPHPRSKTVPEKSLIDFDPEIDQRFQDLYRSAFFIFKSISD